MKDLSHNETGNPLPPLNGLFFPISDKESLYAQVHIHDSTYMAFVTPVVVHWLEQEIAMRGRSDDPLHLEPTLYHGVASRSLMKTKRARVTVTIQQWTNMFM